jgi:hypothetical protein
MSLYLSPGVIMHVSLFHQAVLFFLGDPGRAQI